MIGKLGRRLNDPHQPALRFGAYLGASLAPAPLSIAWGKRIVDWDMLANDEASDCVEATAAHAIMLWSDEAGAPKRPSAADVLAFYGAVTGYPKTDDGTVPDAAWAYWQDTGFAGDKLLARARIDVRQVDIVKRAIALLGCCSLGLALPMSAQDQVEWQSVGIDVDDGGPWGMHEVLLTGYDLDSAECITWGARKYLDWSFLGRYGIEAEALVSRDFITASGVTPSHLDLDRMLADQAALAAA